MSTAQTPPVSTAYNGAKLRAFAIGALFALVLLLPKLLGLRRNPRSWFAFRILLGAAGAALVVLPLGLWNSWFLALLGLAMFSAAALLPSKRQEISVDDRAREFGALVVINGGVCRHGQDRPAAVQLFVGMEHIGAFDAHLRPLLVIPVAEIRGLRVMQVPGAESHRWCLRIEGLDDAAEFVFTGFFAEHRARVAESAIQSVIPTALPILQPREQEQTAEEPPRRRAAGA